MSRCLLRLLVGLEVLGGVAVLAAFLGLGRHGLGGLAVSAHPAADHHVPLAVAAILAAVVVVAVALVAVAEALDRVARGRRSAGEHRLDAAVAHHAGPGRDQLTDDDVLLEADELVALA